ncbi:hypothetical protein IE53DRAFT_374565 [Violaceomyces palustris]|uniref:Uncharacterized protein n=1 Tax=Violaceomyces palustris TaxID=1673888 RepID=A0ACD0NXN0_9BASI|nr:hypothetical protein IE53DRAFT_374565 [Violaceomyces palustris]
MLGNLRSRLPSLRVYNDDGTPATLYSSKDIRPLPVADRTWNHITYFTFWFSAVATVSNWYGATVPLSVGLNVWEGTFCTMAGQFLIAVVMVLSGRGGAVYHVGFPVLSRASFGVRGSWWPAFNRAVMATVWNGVNAVQGGQCVYVMLHAIFPSIARIPNLMGSGSALTSGGMIGFAVYCIINAAFLYIPVPKMKKLVYTKVVVFAISAIAMLAWTLSLAGGVSAVVKQPSKIHGSEKAWQCLRFFLLGASSCATFASNAADFQRYATRPNDVILGQLVGFPLSNLIVAVVGAIVGASSELIFGELVWNPVDLLDRIQTENYTSANRAGCFFIALCFFYSAIFSSIFENSIPAGNDIASLLPQYITIRRGFYICAVFTVAICPWYLLGSASQFISYLASYQVFLSSITGVMLCHYFVIAKGHLEVPDLFLHPSSGGAYSYFKGFNWRAFVAYIAGIVPNLYGFVGNTGRHSISLAGTRSYYFAYEIGVFVSFVLYYLLCKISPIPNRSEKWSEPKDYVAEDDDSRRGQNSTKSTFSQDSEMGEGDDENLSILISLRPSA